MNHDVLDGIVILMLGIRRYEKFKFLCFRRWFISNAASHMLSMLFTKTRFSKIECYNGVWKTCACSVS